MKLYSAVREIDVSYIWILGVKINQKKPWVCLELDEVETGNTGQFLHMTLKVSHNSEFQTLNRPAFRVLAKK